jgi:hypothetical protein
MGRASRRKKAKKQGFQKTFIISESNLKEVFEALQQNADSEVPLPENKTDFSPCPDCWGTEAYAAPSQTIHWGVWRCVTCDRHRGWIDNPANTAKRENENQLIDRVLQTGRLNTWERMFCQSVKQTRKRSPRQIEKLTQIASKLGISTACEGVRV